MSKAPPTTDELVARWNAAVKQASGARTYQEQGRFFVEMADILGDLIVLVDQHTKQPFTKAHTKEHGT